MSDLKHLECIYFLSLVQWYILASGFWTHKTIKFTWKTNYEETTKSSIAAIVLTVVNSQ